MTDYAGLEAGPELDLAIAVNIMQWEQVERWPSFTDHDHILSWIDPKNGRCYIGKPFTSKFHDGKYDRMWERWEPSSSIEAAFTVVNQLADRYHLRLSSPFQVGLEWWAGFTPLGVTGWNGRPDFQASGNTPALAIVRAALAAALKAVEGRG